MKCLKPVLFKSNSTVSDILLFHTLQTNVLIVHHVGQRLLLNALNVKVGLTIKEE